MHIVSVFIVIEYSSHDNVGLHKREVFSLVTFCQLEYSTIVLYYKTLTLNSSIDIAKFFEDIR